MSTEYPSMNSIAPIRMPDSLYPPKIEPPNFGQLLSQDIFDLVNEMQDELSDNEALVVYAHVGNEIVEVREFDFKTMLLLVLKGTDSQRNRCTVITHLSALQLVTKIISVTPEERAGYRVSAP